MLILYGVLLALVTFLSRLAFLFTATTSTSDNIGSTRVTAAQRGRSWLHFDVTNTVVPGTYAYPPLVYWLVSRLPRTWWTRARYGVNYAADTAATLLVWLGLGWLFPTLPAEVPLMAALAFALNPLFLPTIDHARITAPNARSLGLLLNTVWIGLLATWLVQHDWRLLAAMAPLAWIIVLTSQFGMQTMVGLTATTALLTFDPWPLVMMLGSITVGWFVPGLGVREVLGHKFVHWRWYGIVQQTIVNSVSLRARPWRVRVREMLDLFRHPVAQGYSLGRALQTSPWWRLLAGLLPLCAAIVLVAGRGPWPVASLDPVGRALLVIASSAGLLFLATTLPRFVFLGEAERYIEHALPVFTALAVWLVAPDPLLAVTATTLGLLLVLFATIGQLAHRQWPGAQVTLQYPQQGFDEERAMLRLLVDLGRPVRIATVPVKSAFLLHDLLVDEQLDGADRVQFYFQHVRQTGDDRFAYMLEDTADGYTYLKPDLERLVGKYGISVIIVDSQLLLDRGNQEPILEVLRQRTPMHRGRFTVFSLHDLARATTHPVVEPMDAIFPPPKSARQIANERSQRAPAPLIVPATDRPRVLMLADEPQWIFERHALTLQHHLADQFDIRIQYRSDAVDESAFDLIYALEYDLVRPQDIQAPWKWVTAVRSHISWEHIPVPVFTEYLDACFQRTHAVSRKLTSLLAPTLPGIEYVTHGIDGARFTPRVRTGTAGVLRVGWAGNRRSPAKGFEEFVAPLASVPGVELVHCGFVDRNRSLDEMPDFYASLDAYICSSSSEGNNNSLLEAAAMATPIITTRTGTVSEYLRDKVSALIVPRQADAFRTAVERLRDDVTLRQSLGEAAAASVHPKWTWAVRAEDYRRLFVAALADREPARERMEAKRAARRNAGLPLWPALPPRPPAIDLVKEMNRVQEAVAAGDVVTAVACLKSLVLHDAGNPTWSILLDELSPAA